MLSTLASVYDPLGLVAPFILKGRRLLQKLAQSKLGWDDTVGEEGIEGWLLWKRDLEKLNDFQIRRVTNHRTLERSYELNCTRLPTPQSMDTDVLSTFD
jgi:hypothetical protein